MFFPTSSSGTKWRRGVFDLSLIPEKFLTSTLTIYIYNKPKWSVKAKVTLPVGEHFLLSAAPWRFSAELLHPLRGSGALQSAPFGDRRRRKRLRTLKPSKTGQTEVLWAFLSSIWSLEKFLLYWVWGFSSTHHPEGYQLVCRWSLRSCFCSWEASLVRFALTLQYCVRLVALSLYGVDAAYHGARRGRYCSRGTQSGLPDW